MGTRYVTRVGGPTKGGLSRTAPPDCDTVPVTGDSTTVVPPMLTRVCPWLDVGGICTSDVGAALNTGMLEDGTVIFCIAFATETPDTEMTFP